ncbi:hypothetical protein KC906_01810, partial [Candidatus Kaiserbacteria bacterium]|nr:hypothetical protein [Candidatus Kaiserbacteria bacterium]
MGTFGAGTNEFYVSQLIPTSGTLSNFVFRFSTNPGADPSYYWIVGIRVNGSTLYTDTVSDTEQLGVINTDVSVSAGDVVAFSFQPSAFPSTPADAQVATTCYFEPDTDGETILMGMTGANTISVSADRFMAMYGRTIPTGTEGNYWQPIPTDGTLKKLYVEQDRDAGSGSDAYRYTLRLNGADTSVTTTLTVPDTAGNDTTNTASVSAGDYLTLRVEPVDTPGSAPRVRYSCVFVSDTSGEFLILGGTTNSLNTSSTEYNGLPTHYYNWNGSELFQCILHPCTLSKFNVILNGAPGASTDYTFNLYIDGADSNSEVTIADTATYGIDSTNTDYIGNNSLPISMKVVP